MLGCFIHLKELSFMLEIARQKMGDQEILRRFKCFGIEEWLEDPKSWRDRLRFLALLTENSPVLTSTTR